MKCDYCNKKAIANYQKIWVRYIVNDYDYTADVDYTGEEPMEEDNRHVCEKHEASMGLK